MNGYGWFRAGKTPVVRQKTGYQNFYTYSAVCATTGDNFTLFLPGVDTGLMNLYLEQFSQAYSDSKILLVMDQAGWHRSSGLRIPNNITILHLPPYSPELNPVELLWRYLKRHVLRNRFYETLSSLVDTLADFIRILPDKIVQSICAGYLRIYK